MRKRRQHSEDHSDETWLIPYADLLTLLLALFIVLFATSQIDQKKFDQLSRSFSAAFNGGESFFQPSSLIPLDDISLSPNRFPEKEEEPDLSKLTEEERAQLEQYNLETQDLKQLEQEMNAYISENGLKTQLDTKLSATQLTITIRDNALFASGSAVVRDDARNLAIDIAKMLEQHPGYEIVVSGHTDDRPIHTVEFPSNWDLSLKRAGNFMKYLLDNPKLDPRRFSAVGYGEYHPIETNETAEGRGANRRVEVSILRTIKESPNPVISVD